MQTVPRGAKGFWLQTLSQGPGIEHNAKGELRTAIVEFTGIRGTVCYHLTINRGPEKLMGAVGGNRERMRGLEAPALSEPLRHPATLSPDQTQINILGGMS